MTHVLVGTDQSIWCARQFRPAQVLARLGGFGLGVAAFGTSQNDDVVLARLDIQSALIQDGLHKVAAIG